MSRLHEWSELQKVRPVEELPDVTGGRDGELLLKQLVGASFQFKNAHLLTGRRIPSKGQGRRREIDLIVCTPQMIHLIEVKNWSGRLEVRQGAWRQTRRGGDVVDHGNLLETNLLKQDAVVEYLRERGVALDDRTIRGHIAPKIIFTNPNLQLEQAIEARPDVISRRELDDYLQKQAAKKGRAESMFSSLIDCCLAREPKPGESLGSATSGQIPAAPYQQIVSCLTEVGTWDQLQHYGGRAVTGDVVSLRLGGTIFRVGELREKAGLRPIRVQWTRGRSWGLFKAITGLGALGSLKLGRTRFKLSTTDTVMFHAVGEPETTVRKLVDLQQVVLGS
ncbi:nuclease-related domain-containing protein [Singulisphaera sp. GP187]|uniref:nuclease-related domain-containing protein n=1 Tax=Singulisphaera sp. GP187 TaxID=1882752 RepID=UPI0020B168A4|nr:nuclease-related domain-containing protein [Singulisphaera sp. GP187]